jgi:cation/acetate symporter
MIGGSFMAIALVLVSPNMTYPKLVLASANKVLAGTPAHDGKPAVPGAAEKVVALKGKLNAAKDAAEKKSITLELMRAQRTHDKAVADIKKFEGQTTSIMGLEKPLISLKNPGLISVPFGFLMVLIFSLMTRDKRSEEMWEELYVRQNTGINAEKATVH